jgi:hypothetical protein
MKPFDLQKALAGEPVVTYQGLEVTEIVYFKTCATPHQVQYVAGGFIYSVDIQGKSQKGLTYTNLFMKESEMFVNVYLLSSGKKHATIHESLDAAMSHRHTWPEIIGFLGTFKLVKQ